MRGGKAENGGGSRKRPTAQPAKAQRQRQGPKRGEKKREWGAFETGDDTATAVPAARQPRVKE
jgi:hypothetical protein